MDVNAKETGLITWGPGQRYNASHLLDAVSHSVELSGLLEEDLTFIALYKRADGDSGDVLVSCHSCSIFERLNSCYLYPLQR